MFKKSSVDTLASVILTDVKSGTIDPDMLRRFYRQGKRDARRQTFEPSREFIVHAVALANSKICEEFTAQREKALTARTDLATELNQAQEQLEILDADIKPVAVPSSPKSDPSPGPTPGSLERLAEVRAQKRMQAAHSQRQAALAQISELRSQLSSSDDRLVSMPEQYEQAAASCREIGNLLWARYCMGFEKGKRKRLSPDDSLDGPPSELPFEVPCDFAAPQPSSESLGGT